MNLIIDIVYELERQERVNEYDFREAIGLLHQASEAYNKALFIPDVVKSLPTKEKLNFDDWLEFRKVDKLYDGTYRWEGSLYTEYYVKNTYETYLK